MEILSIIVAFCGGFVGASIGAIPAFIMTGFFAIISGILGLSGISDNTLGIIAFGPFFGPHITFAAGAAAAAFAKNRRNKLESSQEILTPLFGKNDPAILLVGGLYGILGYIIWYLISNQTVLITDFPAVSVTGVLIINRYVLGNTGITGKPLNGQKKVWKPTTIEIIHHGLFGAVLGLLVIIGAKQLIGVGISEENMKIYPVLIFGISAFSLIFLQAGWSIPITHHIAYPAAAVYIMSGSIVVATIFSTLNSIGWVLAAKIFNTDCDTYIDPPAIVIATSLLIANLVF
ncbi:MAG: hypothetical protein SOR77_09695 [Peptoniphilus sp.]|uniref:hypothetical protein n=1 Tax=Peptoniphilus sp. TaxID=1971214 RepID=UPI002A74CF76|nr:hypothetical protein [Peptoniphilus sp.]MDY2987892.1 hypothetical protein [Peptoniphilus sp.]